MINFDTLPMNAPTNLNLIDPGVYTGTITKAEMKQPKDDSKPPYLSLVWDVKDDSGRSLGKVFDIITESESDYMKYKIRCFVSGIKVNLGQSFELKDLAKISTGKTCKITVALDTKSEPNKNSINIFAKDMYKAIEKPDLSETPFIDDSAEEPNADADY